MADPKATGHLLDISLASRLVAIGLHPQAVSVLSRLAPYQVRRLRDLQAQPVKTGPSRFVQSLCRYAPEVGLSSLFLAEVEAAIGLPCAAPAACHGCRIGPAHRDFCRHRFPDLYLAYVRLFLRNRHMVQRLARHREVGNYAPLSATSCYYLHVGYRTRQLAPVDCGFCGSRYYYLTSNARPTSCPACGHQHRPDFVHRVTRRRAPKLDRAGGPRRLSP
ncbi:MAG: hypothetical protein EA356_15520 [Geminicoccaceae bacterium]|nr:MAG: hypothetical protein EA356_15520 [Geminicoccaceae bacterium]